MCPATTLSGLMVLRPRTQGSSFLATLGWRAQSLRDCEREGRSCAAYDALQWQSPRTFWRNWAYTREGTPHPSPLPFGRRGRKLVLCRFGGQKCESFREILPPSDGRREKFR